MLLLLQRVESLPQPCTPGPGRVYCTRCLAPYITPGAIKQGRSSCQRCEKFAASLTPTMLKRLRDRFGLGPPPVAAAAAVPGKCYSLLLQSKAVTLQELTRGSVCRAAQPAVAQPAPLIPVTFTAPSPAPGKCHSSLLQSRAMKLHLAKLTKCSVAVQPSPLLPHPPLPLQLQLQMQPPPPRLLR